MKQAENQQLNRQKNEQEEVTNEGIILNIKSDYSILNEMINDPNFFKIYCNTIYTKFDLYKKRIQIIV